MQQQIEPNISQNGENTMAKHINLQWSDEHGNSIHRKVLFVGNKFLDISEKEYYLGGHYHTGNNGTLFHCSPWGNNQKQLLIKILHKVDQNHRDRFDFEIQVLESLSECPNILEMITFGEIETTFEESLPFIITEKYEGDLHGEVIQNGKLSIDKVLKYSVQILNAFEYIHKQNIVHRDIKPTNFLIKNENIFVADFGLAKTFFGDGVDRFYRKDITLAGEMVGPIQWMSPELIEYQFNNKILIDNRSDIFQIGLIMWFMLTGEIVRGIIEPEDDPTDGRFYEIVAKMIKQKPERRFQSIGDVKNALSESYGLTF